jgi:hypothetical protein
MWGLAYSESNLPCSSFSGDARLLKFSFACPSVPHRSKTVHTLTIIPLLLPRRNPGAAVLKYLSHRTHALRPHLYLLQTLADRLSGYVQAYTCYGSVRPFGISTLVAGIDKTGPRLYAIEPSGIFYGYKATASGKGKALAKTELEKSVDKGLSCREGVMELARM